MDLLCINDNYASDTLVFWKENGVDYPKNNKIYSLRQMIRHSHGKIGIRVNEIINPEIFVKHSVLGSCKIEPTFKLERFRTLQGDVITKEMLENVDVNV